MRIAIISHGVADQSTLGGPGRVAIEHANGLAQRGHEVRVVTSDLIWKGRRAKNPTFSLIRFDEVEVRHAPAYSFSRWPGSVGPVWGPSSKALLREVVDWADVIHGHEWPHSMIQFSRRLAHRGSKPFIAQPHGSIQKRQGPRRLLHGLFNALHRPHETDVFLSGSERESDEIRSFTGNFSPLYKIDNPMSPLDITAIKHAAEIKRRSWNLPDGARAVLYAHRIVPNKGLDLAIEALALLPDDYFLIVVGEETRQSFAAECRSLVTELGLEGRVSFTGPAQFNEIDEVVLASDLFLLPARRDTFPLMVLHALRCGVPTVITNGCQSVESLGNAVLVAEPNPASIAETLGSVSQPIASSLASAGNELMLEKYSPYAIAIELERIYEQALDQHRAMGSG